MNIEQLKAARDDLDEWNDADLDADSFLILHEDTIRTLLDQAINAPDLKSLKREVIEHFSPLNSTDGGLVARVIDHLAPRIVREGMVVVPEEPTDEIIQAMSRAVNKETLIQPINITDLYKSVYKAMIDASKGD